MTASWRRLGPGEIDHELLWSLLGIAMTAGAVAMLVTLGLPPYTCAFKSITGLPCLTCGATRALLALVQGAWRDSLWLNPLVLPGAALGAMYVPYALTVSLLERPRLRVALSSRDWRVARGVVVAVVVGVWSYLIAAGR